MGLADIHMHTIFSYDGTAPVPAVLKRAKKLGLDIIAITDHDEIRGALLAEQLAPVLDIQVIPGVEITTADGDLLALSIHRIIPAGLSLLETLERVGDQGGFCVAPHPTATGLGMKSLNAFSIRQALRNPDTAQILIGLETYNATVLDREANQAARILAELSEVAQTGSSDAHVLEAIGLGATIFPGSSIADLKAALQDGTTQVRRGPEWGAIRILGGWAANYLKSAPAHLAPALAQ